MCPYDVATNLPDDELRELFSDVPEDARFTVITDSCHSGTITRAHRRTSPGLRTPDDRRVRFLNPALRGHPPLSNPFKA